MAWASGTAQALQGDVVVGFGIVGIVVAGEVVVEAVVCIDAGSDRYFVVVAVDAAVLAAAVPVAADEERRAYSGPHLAFGSGRNSALPAVAPLVRTAMSSPRRLWTAQWGD